ncbi:antibiotic biosynthesis monooxygenase family protein [Peribacillus alkalitolerans]|uniref:antibiotic biosynthesis monooxygenase family protein n=1 Tax=Peribacillus alkalitolerans TaxID=1550385 RepID=UPI0013D7EB50|nr:antibiotic biosynthesis monooxygenase [Peribacillus alkalitolerans]
MFVHITSGTFDFLRKKLDQHREENMYLLQNAEGTLLVHETNDKKSVFSQPRSYEYVDAVGELKQKGFIVMNNIPVSKEGRPIFEHRFKNRPGQIENQPGFWAIRILRPLHSDTYIILTQWENEKSFHEWQNSQSFAHSHSQKEGGQETTSTTKIFSGSSYISKYIVPVLEDEAF